MNIGSAFRFVREHKQMTQKEVCSILEITQVHLSNLETGKSDPSWDLMAKFKSHFGVDPYILAWCLFGEVDDLPEPCRKPMAALQRAWKREITVALGAVV